MLIPKSIFGSFWYNMSGQGSGNHFNKPHQVRQVGLHTGLHNLQLYFPICLFYIKWTLPVLHSLALALLSFPALLQGAHPETTQILRSQLDNQITGPYLEPESLLSSHFPDFISPSLFP